MDDRKMEIIQQLMEELQDEMHPSEDELGDRLGRPKVEVMKMQSGMPDDDDMEGDMHGMGPMEPDEDDMDPDNMLKQRLMKLRG